MWPLLINGLRRLGEDFPLSLRLLKEIHSVLLSKGRGKECDPGEFRRSQNWIGGSRPGNAAFVPPPPEYLQECMGKLNCFCMICRKKLRCDQGGIGTCPV